MKRIIFILLIVTISSNVFSQIKLSLLDGHQRTLESYVFRSDEGIDYIEYSFVNDKGKQKTAYTDMEDVYSLTMNGRDSIIYTQYEEGEFTVPQMTQVVVARQLALNEYNPWWAMAGGMLVGCGSMFIPMDAFTRLLIPIAYTVGMGFAKPRESYVIKHYNYAEGDEWFVYGYQNAGRKKIFKNTIIGAVGGLFIAGAIAGTLQLIEGDN